MHIAVARFNFFFFRVPTDHGYVLASFFEYLDLPISLTTLTSVRVDSSFSVYLLVQYRFFLALNQQTVIQRRVFNINSEFSTQE